MSHKRRWTAPQPPVYTIMPTVSPRSAFWEQPRPMAMTPLVSACSKPARTRRTFTPMSGTPSRRPLVVVPKYATTTEYVLNGDSQVATVDQQTASVSATRTAKTRYIHPDHLGSTNVVTDENDNVVQTLDYYPYGGTRITVGTSTKEKRQSYLQARYYEPSRGQFLSQDPVFWGEPQQQILADPQSFNTYSYSLGNPISRKDPDGRMAGSAGVDFSAWNISGSFGVTFDQRGIDYYNGWGVAAGVHGGVNAGLSTDNLSHKYSVTNSVYAASGDVYGGENLL